MPDEPKIRLEWVPSAYRRQAATQQKPVTHMPGAYSAMYTSGGITGKHPQKHAKKPRYR